MPPKALPPKPRANHGTRNLTQTMSGGPVPYYQKYTAASTGIWAKIRSFLTPVANRSSGNPIVPIYRQPPPGQQKHNDMLHDVGTFPTVDIKENPYWKRDHRRNYPQTAVFDQSAVAGLLKFGSVASPRIAKGEAGDKQLATVANGEVSLVNTLKSVDLSTEVLENGLPPLPARATDKTYKLLAFEQHGMYPEGYPCRMFH